MATRRGLAWACIAFEKPLLTKLLSSEHLGEVGQSHSVCIYNQYGNYREDGIETNRPKLHSHCFSPFLLKPVFSLHVQCEVYSKHEECTLTSPTSDQLQHAVYSGCLNELMNSNRSRISHPNPTLSAWSVLDEWDHWAYRPLSLQWSISPAWEGGICTPCLRWLQSSHFLVGLHRVRPIACSTA